MILILSGLFTFREGPALLKAFEKLTEGNKIDLSTAVDITLKCTLNFKIPEPLRAAHITANQMKAQYQRSFDDR